MSIPGLVLLPFLALSACQGHAATLVPTSSFLQENIRMLNEILKMKVSCGKMNVTNIFAGGETDDLEILCKATTVTWESRSCHTYLEGISLNLFSLVRRKSKVLKVPCPVGTGSTTSLDNFLVDLRRVLQRLVKDQS